MPGHISVSLLDMPAVGHNNYGLWRHPSNRKRDYRSLSYWCDLARACERARFDALFDADVLAVATGFGGSREVALREGMHVPSLDPFTYISAMAAVTTHLGFVTTASTTYEHPFALARRFSSLDHLTQGRIGFNVVTSYLPGANDNFGVDAEALTHDQKYDRADEFMEVCYKLWEASWEDGAIVADEASATWADPDRVHPIDHRGTWFTCAGPHLVDPSPQRTPVIFQAGSSPRGVAFAARHAEVVFVGGRTVEAVRANVANLRQAARDRGRDPATLRILCMYSFVTAPTKSGAEARLAELNALSRAEGYIAHSSGAGFDLTRFRKDELVTDIVERGGPGAEHMKRYPYDPGTTVADVYRMYQTVDQAMPFACGTPDEVADHLIGCVDDMGLDGILLRQTLTPGTVNDFADFVMPELQRRGRYRTDYEGASLREHATGASGARVTAPHAAAALRPSTMQRPKAAVS